MLSGFTMTNGGVDQGGIYCDGASPTIEKNMIENNSGGTLGWAIYCANTEAIIRRNRMDREPASRLHRTMPEEIVCRYPWLSRQHGVAPMTEVAYPT